MLIHLIQSDLLSVLLLLELIIGRENTTRLRIIEGVIMKIFSKLDSSLKKAKEKDIYKYVKLMGTIIIQPVQNARVVSCCYTTLSHFINNPKYRCVLQRHLIELPIPSFNFGFDAHFGLDKLSVYEFYSSLYYNNLHKIYNLTNEDIKVILDLCNISNSFDFLVLLKHLCKYYDETVAINQCMILNKITDNIQV